MLKMLRTAEKKSRIESVNGSAGDTDHVMQHSAMFTDQIGQAGVFAGQVLHRIHFMEKDIDRLTGVIALLEHQSRTTDSIIETISDIAVHTGLLSLNASIKVAKAGTQDAGFGGIVQEIRQLSQKTSKAAQEVKDSLLVVSELIQETVSAVERVHNKRNVSGIQSDQEESIALQQVRQNHRQFHTQLESVVNSVGDQLQAVAQIAGNLTKITNIGREKKR